MGAIIVILAAAGIGVGALMLRGIPRRKQLALTLLAVVWTAIAIGAANLVGGIAPEYRGNIAIQRLLRETNHALQSGDCERARAAFSEANRVVEGGGKLHDAVTTIGERLRASTSASEPVVQPR